MVLSLFAVGFADGQAPVDKTKAEDKLWWIFLNKGKNPKEGVSQDQVSKWQAEHVANFGTLAGQGRCFAAGPLGSNGFIRGTVVVKAKDKAGVADCFKNDPFVQNGLLDVEAYAILTPESSFKKPKEPFALAEFTLVIFKKGPKWTAEPSHDLSTRQADHVARLQAMLKTGDLAMASPLAEGQDKRGICIFWSKDAKEVAKLLDADPHVVAEHLIYELHPQYMADGVFGERPGKD
ncbi:MAG: hypothetical protein KF784_07755 [Fimbriimonadaceae bacterium]|nr:hypothetical protein [Fimbriimonadaceae bacterium]